jgi:hypothetical protein
MAYAGQGAIGIRPPGGPLLVNRMGSPMVL